MATLRKLFALVLILIAYQSYGQQPQYLGNRRSRIIVPNQLQVDSLFVLPGRTDTNFVPYKAGSVIYRLADAKLYFHNGSKWQPVSTLTGTPVYGAAGSNTQVQVNVGGNFAGSTKLTNDTTTGLLSVNSGQLNVNYTSPAALTGLKWSSNIFMGSNTGALMTERRADIWTFTDGQSPNLTLATKQPTLSTSTFSLAIAGSALSFSNYASQGDHVYSHGGLTPGNKIIFANSFFIPQGTLNLNVGDPTDYASSQFTVNSSTKGMLGPRMLEAQRLAISSPAIGLFVYQVDNNEGYYEYTSTGWRRVWNPSSTGEIATASNVGSGAQVFQAKVGSEFRFRSLIAANTNLTVTQNANDITLQVKNFVDSVRKKSGTDSVFFYTGGSGTFGFVDLSSGSGEANTASNVGSGTGLFKAKSGVDLQFKSLTSDTTIALTSNTNDVQVKVDQTRITSVKRLQDSLVVIRGITSNGLHGILGIGNKTSRTIYDTTSQDGFVGWYGEPNNYGVNYGTDPVYGLIGTAGRFHGNSWQTFPGVNPYSRPNVVGTFWGYNHTTGGGRETTNDAGFGFRTETMFRGGGANLFELHLPAFTDTAGVEHRIQSAYIVKNGKEPVVWQYEGGGHSFTSWNNQSETWGSITNSGRLELYYNNKALSTWPGIVLGSLRDSVNGTPWAAKWNMSLLNVQQEIWLGHTTTTAADNGRVRLFDDLFIGNTGVNNRRDLQLYGTASITEGNLVVDNTSGVGNSLIVYHNGVRKLDVGATFTEVTNDLYGYKGARFTDGVAIGASAGSFPSTGILLDMKETAKTTLFPKLSTTTRNGITAQSAMLHYNSDTATFEYNDGGWKQIASREWVRSIYTAIPSQTGNSGKYLTTDGTNLSWAAVAGGSGTPGGANEQIQVNNAGVFAGYANLTWKNASTSLGIGSAGTSAYLNLTAGTTSKALFNFGTGAAPTSPSSGDFWFDVADSSFKYRVGSNSLKWLFSKDQVISTGLLLKSGAGLVADTLMVGGGTAGQALISNGSTSAAIWTDLPAFAEGTYTATVTNVTNVASSSVTTCNYTRRGNYIEVFGEITIDPTATGDTKLRISLPVATGITNSYELSGQATTFDNVQSVRIYHELGEAVFRLNASVDASSHVYSFRFIYKYIAP